MQSKSSEKKGTDQVYEIGKRREIELLKQQQQQQRQQQQQQQIVRVGAGAGVLDVGKGRYMETDVL